MGIDPYRRSPDEITNPAQKAFVITPSDSVDLEESTRAVWVGSTGNLAVILVGDSAAVTFVGVQSGSLLPLRVKRVMDTNTTAQNIVGVY